MYYQEPERKRGKYFNFYKKIKQGLVLTISLFCLVLIFYSNFKYQGEVVFLDIGQGDASLFKFNNKKIILVDGGPDNLVLRRLGEELPFYKRQIDYLIISHWHDDHFIGLIEVLRRFQVKNLVYAEGLKNSFLTEFVLREAKQRGVKISTIQTQSFIKVDDSCFIKLFNPLSLGIKEDGNNSLLFKLNCLGKKFLLAGDNEKAAEDALLQADFPLQAQIFKASHHGSQTSNQKSFLLAIDPEVVIISAGLNNKFKHPSLRVLKNIHDLGIKIRRTDLEGSIRFPLKNTSYP